MFAYPSILARSLSFAVALGIGACAMSAPNSGAPECLVSGGEKILARAGGSAGLCDSIRHALAGHSISRVEVRVSEKSIFAMRVTLSDGRVLPDLSFAQNDGRITRTTFLKIADAIVRHVTSAGNR